MSYGSPAITLAQRPVKITTEVAKAEKAKREKARRHYKDFRNYVAPWFVDAPHNLLLAEVFEKVERYVSSEGKEAREYGRVIISMPAQYGKSLDAAQLFPAWLLGRNPNKRIGITSYASSLSDGHSAFVRDLVASDSFQKIFGDGSNQYIPVDISEDEASRSDWKLAPPFRGGCVSRGIGGGFSGKGVDVLLVDDPTKDIKEARSETHQKELMDWYESVAYQRLSKGGAIIIVHTRWDPNDLAGQLLKKMASNDPKATQWKMIYLPALALELDEYPKTKEQYKENLLKGFCIPMEGDALGRKPGEALCEFLHPLETILTKKANVSPFVFTAMDQQLPKAFTGGKFDEADIQIMDPLAVPENMKWYAYVDLALGKKVTSDFNCVMPGALRNDTGDYILRDLYREQNLYKFLPRLKNLMLLERNRGVYWGIEGTAFQTLVFSQFRGDPELALVKMIEIKPTESKMDRAESASLYGKEKHLWLVSGEWNQTAIREMTLYPYGEHDDIVDLLGGNLAVMTEVNKTKHLEAKIL
jgi:phage terminase large subunit-like protein